MTLKYFHLTPYDFFRFGSLSLISLSHCRNWDITLMANVKPRDKVYGQTLK